MSQINYMHVMTEKEVEEYNKQTMKWLKHAVYGDFGMEVHNHVSSFVHSLRTIAQNWCKHNYKRHKEYDNVLVCTKCDKSINERELTKGS